MRAREGAYKVTLPGKLTCTGLSDLGEDNSAMPKSLLQSIKNTSVKVNYQNFTEPFHLKASIDLPDGVPFTASEKFRMDIRIALPCGPLSIRKVDSWVVEQGMNKIIFGKPLLKPIGLDLDSLLSGLAEEGKEIYALQTRITDKKPS